MARARGCGEERSDGEGDGEGWRCSGGGQSDGSTMARARNRWKKRVLRGIV